MTLHRDFQDNMLSESVFKIDVCRYLEENWPLDDEDLERVHKLYRLIAYQRCSRSVFQILRVTLTGKFANCAPEISKIYYKICREHQNCAAEISVAQYKLSRLACHYVWSITCHYERMHKCMHTEIIECSIICSVY